MATSKAVCSRPAVLATMAVAAFGAMSGASAWADNAGSSVEKCNKSFGTLAVAKSQTGWGHLSQYGLGPPAALLRMMVQSAGCFDVVERRIGLQNLQQERAMAQSGDLRQDSSLGKGQLQAADFVMAPAVQIGAQTTGGVGGALLGRLGAAVATLQRSDELVATGDAKNGFVAVDSANVSGWVQRTLVGPVAGAAPPQVQPAALPLLAIAYRYGNFRGTVDGAEKGVFKMFIDDKGQISGDGSLSRTGAFGLMGQYDMAQGRLAMYGSSAAGAVMLIGRIDAARGEISGNWSDGSQAGAITGLSAGGAFVAQRQ